VPTKSVVSQVNPALALIMGSFGTSALEFSSNFTNTINGEQRNTEVTRHAYNPATEAANPEVPVSTQADVDEAVAAARLAFRTWSKLSYDERRKAIYGFADALECHLDVFSRLLTQEQGKPVRPSYQSE
jgi:acyl-CoA reductase-like NAD-dependent aldehyde dehydrogenase